MTEPASEPEDRATELAERFEEAADRIVPLLDEEGELSSEDEDAVGDALAAYAEVAGEADFEAFLRAAGFEDLPEDPEPADLPALVGRADEAEVDTVHRLLGLRDLADEWGDLGSDEREERLRELFAGVTTGGEEGDDVTSDEDQAAAETEEAEEAGDADETEGGAESEGDERSEGLASFVDRLRDASDRLSETAAESVAEEAEEAAEAVTPGEDEADEESDEEAEEEDESKLTSRSRRGRFSSMPSHRPDMRGVGRKSTMPRRKRD